MNGGNWNDPILTNLDIERIEKCLRMKHYPIRPDALTIRAFMWRWAAISTSSRHWEPYAEGGRFYLGETIFHFDFGEGVVDNVLPGNEIRCWFPEQNNIILLKHYGNRHCQRFETYIWPYEYEKSWLMSRVRRGGFTEATIEELKRNIISEFGSQPVYRPQPVPARKRTKQYDNILEACHFNYPGCPSGMIPRNFHSNRYYSTKFN